MQIQQVNICKAFRIVSDMSTSYYEFDCVSSIGVCQLFQRYLELKVLFGVIDWGSYVESPVVQVQV